MLAVGSKCPTRPDAHGEQMTAQGWRGVEIISEEDAVAARPPCDELSDCWRFALACSAHLSTEMDWGEVVLVTVSECLRV
jgi:hypothetical protein